MRPATPTPVIATSSKSAPAGSVPAIEPKKILTDKEIEILQLIARGVCLKQMALILKITTSTLGKHRSGLERKLSEGLGIEMSPCMLIHYALATGLVANKFSSKKSA